MARKNKKPIYKKWWFWLLIAMFIHGSFLSTSKTINNTATMPEVVVSTVSSTEVTTEATIEATTESTTEPIIMETVPTETTKPVAQQYDYVLNINTMKFHWPSCGSAKKISAKNRQDFTGTRDEVVSMGYGSCGQCHP